MHNKDTSLNTCDPEIAQAIDQEATRQEEQIELIASENYVSPAVLTAQGSVLTNKYAEGYPGKRYYGGCEYVDICESLAIERAKKLFQADYANVQPHSGSQANTAALMALLNPGDPILGMDLSHGGHLTHGAKINFSGRLYDSHFYGVNHQGYIDYDEVEKIAMAVKPKLLITGISAYSRILDWKRFREIADKVGALMLADMAHVAGLVATGLYPSPLPFADVVTTTTHKTLRGPRGGMILAKGNPEIEKKLNSIVFPGIQGGPLMHVIAAKAVAFREALEPDFKIYQEQVIRNADTMAKRFIERGFDIVSGGTDSHVFLIDLIKKNLSGKEAEAALHDANITVNKNTVPQEPRSAFVTSGLRLGTPAVTTRGFKEKEIIQITDWIGDILDDINNTQRKAQIKQAVLTLCQAFPVYR
jgi:glycine hydroxymethyltransferase